MTVFLGPGPKSWVHSWVYPYGPGAEKWGPFMGVFLRARGRKVGSIHGVWSFQGAFWGPQQKKWGSILGGFVGGQGPKDGIHYRGHYWVPGAKKWGPFIGAL